MDFVDWVWGDLFEGSMCVFCAKCWQLWGVCVFFVVSFCAYPILRVRLLFFEGYGLVSGFRALRLSLR